MDESRNINFRMYVFDGVDPHALDRVDVFKMDKQRVVVFLHACVEHWTDVFQQLQEVVGYLWPAEKHLDLAAKGVDCD